MMNRRRRAIRILLVSGIFLYQFMVMGVTLASELPPGPDRFTNITEEYIQYTWWVTQWTDNETICEVNIDHGGTPSGLEILEKCGKSIHSRWLTSEVCDTASIDPEVCDGLYLQLIQESSASRNVPVVLPPATVWLTVQGCLPFASTHRCADVPVLVVTGEEPLTGYSILRLEGTIDDDPFICEPVCQIDLAPTDEEGIIIKFWAYSSYGDSSEIFEARIRVQQSESEDDPYMYFDILSDQWRGSAQAPCMEIWNTFPPAGGLTDWLATPPNYDELASRVSYDYLAGALIKQGVVETSGCLDGGLLRNGYASSCGMDAAKDQVYEWQNRFDEIIYSSALEIGIPAQLLKNIFSRESQFWPGNLSGHPEAGLGQMTKNGADTTFLWNRPFYEQFCATVFDESACAKGYPHLADQEKVLLQEALVQSVDGTCEDCPLKIDIGKSESSVWVFANALLANCAQTDMVLDLNYSTGGYSPLYGDLWKFTLVNYNAGPGCLGLAVNKTSTLGELLTWENVSKNLTATCKPAQEYVNDITVVSP